MPLVHGSQGCATYIRRYLISHYKEPVDIASSNFSEETTIFGGNHNFNRSISNIISQYAPRMIGIATTCLSETIGEDVDRMLYEYETVYAGTPIPRLVAVSTPSYQGSHTDGFHEAVRAVVQKLVTPALAEPGVRLNVLPGMLSPADLRYLKEILAGFETEFTLLPDYSDTLDQPVWSHYHQLAPGGTPVEELEQMGSAAATLELGMVLNRGLLRERVRNSKSVVSAGEYLEAQFNIPNHRIPLPVGVNATDRMMKTLSQILGNKPIPEIHKQERGRLLDAYADGHKYLFGKKVVVYGEEDLVLGLCAFLDEVGCRVVLAATGGESGYFASELAAALPNHVEPPVAGLGWDFERIGKEAERLKPDLMIGHSKGYYLARALQIPLVRVGFPIHDRLGGQRLLHIGYRGTQQLFDRVVNALLEYKQNHSPVGYKYM